MTFIIGGAYQGKLNYALENLGITGEDVFECEDSTIDFSKRCIYHLERYVRACVRENRDPEALFRENPDLWQDAVIICEDIFCGVVPIEAELRAWREATGRLAGYLSKEAQTVIRLFCGIPTKIKW